MTKHILNTGGVRKVEEDVLGDVEVLKKVHRVSLVQDCNARLMLNYYRVEHSVPILSTESIFILLSASDTILILVDLTTVVYCQLQDH